MRELLKIHNLSTSPFHFPQHVIGNYSFFNCSKEGTDYDCLSGPSYQIYVIPSDTAVEDLTTNCLNKYADLPLPCDGYYTCNYNNKFRLSWLKPTCGQYCEEKGKRCRLKSNATEIEIECYRPKPSKGNNFCSLFIDSALKLSSFFSYVVSNFSNWSVNPIQQDVMYPFDKN